MRSLVYLSLLVGVACADNGTCPTISDVPHDTGDAPIDTGNGSAPTTALLDLEGVAWSFEGVIPGTEDLADSEDCDGQCYRCFYMEDGVLRVVYYVDVPRSYDIATFTYFEQFDRVYNVDLRWSWTGYEAQGLSDALGFLIIEPATGPAVMVEISECQRDIP